MMLTTDAPTGLMFSFSVITVPLLQAPEPGLSEFQRWRLWRKAFERGQATIPAAILPNIVLLAVAAYNAPTAQRRNLLIGATVSLLGVYALTPTIMLRAGLRAELLDSVKTKGGESHTVPVGCPFKLILSPPPRRSKSRAMGDTLPALPQR